EQPSDQPHGRCSQGHRGGEQHVARNGRSGQLQGIPGLTMAQMYRMNWQGRRLWTSRGRARAARGLQLALEHILAESNKLVPLEEGTLQRSEEHTSELQSRENL